MRSEIAHYDGVTTAAFASCETEGKKGGQRGGGDEDEAPIT